MNYASHSVSGILLTVSWILLFSSNTWAADGTSEMPIIEAIKPKKFEEDKRITDNELKAQAGSLSRYSMKFDLSYQGPPVNNLSDANMPNPDNRPRPNRTSLSGYTGLRYRMNPNSAMNMSAGIKWYSPYQQVTGDDTKKPKGEDDYEISNPQVNYDRTYPFLATQMRSSFKGSYITQDYYLDRGQFGGIGYTQAAKYTPRGGRVILGMSADVDWYFYDREYQRRWEGQKTGDGRVSNYYLTFIPSLEYKFTDKLNFKGSVAYSFANLRETGSGWLWDATVPMARAGTRMGCFTGSLLQPVLKLFHHAPGY